MTLAGIVGEIVELLVRGHGVVGVDGGAHQPFAHDQPVATVDDGARTAALADDDALVLLLLALRERDQRSTAEARMRLEAEQLDDGGREVGAPDALLHHAVLGEEPGRDDEDRDVRRLLEVADGVVIADRHVVERRRADVRGGHGLAVVGRHHDDGALAQARVGERLHEHADGLVVLRGLGHVETRGLVGGPRGRRRDALEELGRRLVGLVRRVVVHEHEEARVAVVADPRGRVACHLERVARAIAMIGDVLEAHVHADRGVAHHEVVVHERLRRRAMTARDERQERRIGRVEARRVRLVQHPLLRVEPELARACAGEHREGARPRP